MKYWREFRKMMDKEAFVERFAHPFLLVYPLKDQSQVEFFTTVRRSPFADTNAGARLPEMPIPPKTGECQVVPLVKSAANPYENRIIVGRARNCDVVLRGDDVSKVHGEFKILENGDAELTDRRSSNGTWVNGRRLDAGAKIVIKPGDTIRFASLETVFVSNADLYDRL